MKKALYFFLLVTSFGLHDSVYAEAREAAKSAFDEDVDFLSKYGDVIVLNDPSGRSRIAVMPSLQGRVMTSTPSGTGNLSYGWINRALFESGEISPQKNAFGGEERLWLGPEGGQFSIFFAANSSFTRPNWFTPAMMDRDRWDVAAQDAHSVAFTKSATLTNYSKTKFDIKVSREIRVLDTGDALAELGVTGNGQLTSVAYQTVNDLENTGKAAWNQETGMLMIWLLGRHNPSSDTTIIVPIHADKGKMLGPVLNGEYSARVPKDRLTVDDNAVFFRGDGEHRSKIGLTAERATGLLGTYNPTNQTLTIIKYTTGVPGDVFVNQKWELQEHPFHGGDVVNAYNGGPTATGERPFTPFYELETSSPARALKPGERLRFVQTTAHFQGETEALNGLAMSLLGVSLDQVSNAFTK